MIKHRVARAADDAAKNAGNGQELGERGHPVVAPQRIRRTVGATSALLLAAAVLAPAASASSTTKQVTGSTATLTFTFRSITYASVASLCVSDTPPGDGKAAWGQASYIDAYGGEHYGTRRKNGNGVNTTLCWNNSYLQATGSYGDVIHYVHVGAWVDGGSSQWSSGVLNPYW